MLDKWIWFLKICKITIVKYYFNKLIRITTIASALSLCLTFSSCIRNYEPVISSIIADPNPVSKGGLVNLTCNASDDDYSTRQKDESLSYEWFAAAGEITIGESGNTATWTAPNESGLFSVSCSVTDEYYGLDIATIEITVE